MMPISNEQKCRNRCHALFAQFHGDEEKHKECLEKCKPPIIPQPGSYQPGYRNGCGAFGWNGYTANACNPPDSVRKREAEIAAACSALAITIGPFLAGRCKPKPPKPPVTPGPPYGGTTPQGGWMRYPCSNNPNLVPNRPIISNPNPPPYTPGPPPSLN